MIIAIKISKKMLTRSAEISQSSSNSNPNISETVSHSTINNTIRCIHVNCFNKLRFLAEVSTQSQKKKNTFF